MAFLGRYALGEQPAQRRRGGAGASGVRWRWRAGAGQRQRSAVAHERSECGRPPRLRHAGRHGVQLRRRQRRKRIKPAGGHALPAVRVKMSCTSRSCATGGAPHALREEAGGVALRQPRVLRQKRSEAAQHSVVIGSSLAAGRRRRHARLAGAPAGEAASARRSQPWERRGFAGASGVPFAGQPWDASRRDRQRRIGRPELRSEARRLRHRRRRRRGRVLVSFSGRRFVCSCAFSVPGGWEELFEVGARDTSLRPPGRVEPP